MIRDGGVSLKLDNHRSFWAAGILCLAVALLFCGCGPGKARRLKIGDKAPAFSTTAIDGKRIDPAGLAGKTVIIRFFEPNCPFCRADTKIFNAYFSKYRSQGLEIIYFAEWKNLSGVEDFARKLSPAFPLVYDKNGAIAATYQVKALPQTLLINRKEQIVAALLGGVSEAQLDEIVKPLLAAK